MATPYSDDAPADSNGASVRAAPRTSARTAAGVHTRNLRDRSAEQRQHSSHSRVEAAAVRDAIASARDQAASARDQASVLLDEELATRAAGRQHNGHPIPAVELLERAAENRKRAEAERAAAAEGRSRAETDRQQAALDREQAALDRLQAQADREALLDQLATVRTNLSKLEFAAESG